MFRYFRQTSQFGVRNIKLVELLNYLWWVSPLTSQSTKHRIGMKGRGSRETSFGDFGSEIWLDCFVDWFIFPLELWWYFFFFFGKWSTQCWIGLLLNLWVLFLHLCYKWVKFTFAKYSFHYENTESFSLVAYLKFPLSFYLLYLSDYSSVSLSL